MKQIYYLTTGIVSCILLVLIIYVGNIWMIKQSTKQINRIQIKIGKENTPPPPEYFKAYAWVKLGVDCGIDYSYYSARNTLSATFRDFHYEFGKMVSDSISLPKWQEVRSKIGYTVEEKDSMMAILEISQKPLYDLLNNSWGVTDLFLREGSLQISKLDKKQYSYLFDFLTKSNALQNTCKGWLPFLELYAKEENNSSALNCCKDILAFRPDS